MEGAFQSDLVRFLSVYHKKQKVTYIYTYCIKIYILNIEMNSTWEAAREVMEARAARAEWRRYQAAAARNEAMYQERMRARTAAPRVPVPPPVRVPAPKVQVETPNTRGKLAAYHINRIRYNAPSAASAPAPAPAHVPLALKNGNFNDNNKIHN